MLTFSWPPNTTYIEVLARERQSQTNRNQQQSNSYSYYLFLRKATFRLRWPALKVGMDFYYCLACKLTQLDLMNSNKTVICNVVQKCQLS